MFGLTEKIPDDANRLAERLQTCNTVAGFYELRQAMEARRGWIRARQSEIGGEGIFSGPARTAAIKQGPDAAQAIEKESERLSFELSYLDRLEQLAVAGSNEAEIAQLRADVPKAVKRTAAEAGAVRKALASLDAALVKLNESQLTIARYQDAGIPYPMEIDEVRDLLALRASLWELRSVSLALPPPPIGDEPLRKHVESLPLAYAFKYVGKEFQFTSRVPPVLPRPFATDYL